MGHQRLGTLPRSRSWRQVIDLIRDGADVAEIAAATSRGVEHEIIDAGDDPVVQHTFWLLSKIPLAARKDDFVLELNKLGVDAEQEPMLADVVSAMMATIDRKIIQSGGRTDFGEIAQLCAAESLYSVASRELDTLFECQPEGVQKALASFATVKQFAVLARDFFARLTRRHFNYYLSRELGRHVGPGLRFPSVREHRSFEEALDLHCREATRIIKDYSGEWFSKQNHEGGIDPGKAGRFVKHAAEKLRGELRHRREARVK